jgi:hypothetical protein
MLLIGVPARRFFNAGHLRSVVVTGTIDIVVGILATNVCMKYWQSILAQGVVVGMGSGLLAFTSAAVMPFWFVQRRMLVAEWVGTGSSVGE